MTSLGESNSPRGGDHDPTTDGGTLVHDALTAWLASNPSASEEAPDLVALAQTLARQLEEADKPSDVAVVAREYRMVLKELHWLEGAEDEDDLASALSTPVRDSKKP